MPVKEDWVDRGSSDPATSNNTMAATDMNAQATLLNSLETEMGNKVDDSDGRLSDQRDPRPNSVTASAIVDGTIGFGELNVGGTGTDDTFLKVTADGTMSLATPAGGGGGGSGLPGAGTITNAMLQDGSVDARAITADAVGWSELNAAGTPDASTYLKVAADGSLSAADAIPPDNSITSAKIADNAVTASEIAADSVGWSELNAGGTATDSTFVKVDALGNLSAAIPSGGGGGGDDSALWAEGNIGDGTDGGDDGFTFTHNLHTRSLIFSLFNNSTYEELGPVYNTRDTTTITFYPQVVWPNAGIHVLVRGFVGSSDVTAPTAGTISSPSQTASTITLQANSFTDAVGVTHYRWYNGTTNAQIAETPGNTHVVTGLASGSPFEYYVTGLDDAGNESDPSPTETFSTTTPSPVLVQTIAPAPLARVTSGTTISFDIDVDDDDDLGMAVCLLLSQTTWVSDLTTFTVTCISTIDGPLGFWGNAVQGPGSTSKQGSLWHFKKKAPSVGHHTIEISATGHTLSSLMAFGVVLTGVGDFQPTTKSEPSAAAALAFTATGATDEILFAAHLADALPVGYNKTIMANDGGSVGGTGDFYVASAIAGATNGVSAGVNGQSYSTTSSAHRISSLVGLITKVSS
jgi:chitodextrinase